MKNLLGKFHAELSQQRLASQAEPSQAEPSRAKPSQAEPSQAKPSLLTTAYLFFICQENFMKNLLGKFHAVLYDFFKDTRNLSLFGLVKHLNLP